MKAAVGTSVSRFSVFRPMISLSDTIFGVGDDPAGSTLLHPF